MSTPYKGNLAAVAICLAAFACAPEEVGENEEVARAAGEAPSTEATRRAVNPGGPGPGTSNDCWKAAGSYATTIAACGTTVACWGADAAVLGLGTWACIAASLACMASIPADATYGGACMNWLWGQVQKNCAAEGGNAVWDPVRHVYRCMPQHMGPPPQRPGVMYRDVGGGPNGGGGGWGTTPSGSVQLWCCYTIAGQQICNPC